MLKKLLVIGLVSLGAACTYVQQTPLCPNVVIHKGNDTLIQNAVGNGQFKIELTGYEGYCFMDEKINRAKARITPLFRIFRLNNLDETDVHFTYYTDTVQGPPQYLGKRFYNETVNIPYAVRQKAFRGRPIETKIPDISGANFEIAMGLAVTAENAGNDAYKPQNYTFRYAVDPEELRSRTYYETVPSNYGMEMYYAEQAQQELERQQAAAPAIAYHEETTRRRRYVTQSAPQVIYYQPAPVQSSAPATQAAGYQTVQRSVTPAGAQTRAVAANTTQTTVKTTAPAKTYAAASTGKMNRQMTRRLNCKNCR